MVLEKFVTNNPTNQTIIWSRGNAGLRKLLGPLDLPPWPADFEVRAKRQTPVDVALEVPTGPLVVCHWFSFPPLSR